MLLDPNLVKAARRGDSWELRDLLRQMLDEEVGEVVVTVVDGPDAAIVSHSQVILKGTETTGEGDSLLHLVAACSDGSDKFLNCARAICGTRVGRSLLQARNHIGNTPLHAAAGAGNLDMVSCLLDLAAAGGGDRTAVKELLRKQNNRWETALHQAIRAPRNNKACVEQLMSMDPELACCIPLADGEGQQDSYCSPLYLAISLGEMEIAKHLLEASAGNLLSYSGPDGRNVFHAAVARGTERGRGGGDSSNGDADAALGMLVQWFQEDPPRLPLLLHLTNQRTNSAGVTPLADAAALSATTATTMRLLLEANDSAVYLPSNDGWYPMHVAGGGDKLDLIQILLERCADCATLRDAQGRTFLHVAAMNAWCKVVKYACAQERFSSILNAQDKGGDTALHIAVRAGNLDIFNCLIGNRQVRLDVPNGEGLTPVRVARRMVPTIFYDKMHSSSLIQDSLEVLVGAPRGVLPDTIDDEELSKKLSDATQVMGIVSVLVATVTFASAFTLPGGYLSAGDAANSTRGGGTPLLAGRRSYAFDAFVLADTLAFVCSSMATFSLVFAGMPFMDLHVRYHSFLTSFSLMRAAGRTLLAAFALGLYAVLAPVDRAVAMAVCFIILASLLGGHLETWRVFSTATAALARFGGGLWKPAARLYARALRRYVFGNFWTFIIIFGLPAAIRVVDNKYYGGNNR